MNLHIKQRTLERLRMYQTSLAFFGSNNYEPGAPMWRAIQGAADRAPVTINEMVAAHDAMLTREDWRQPVPDFDRAGFERFCIRCVVTLLVGFTAGVLWVTSRYFFHHENKASVPLPAPQVEKGNLAQ
jgi:hypothetical protein